jgi:antitoxin (DNA-binding transcriptional repressor) of toxin-antitoxin stability system
MKLVEKSEATATLAEYASKIKSGPVIVTQGGRPVAALVAIANADLETVSLSTNRRFLELIERSRLRSRSEGTIPGTEMRRRFESTRKRSTRTR